MGHWDPFSFLSCLALNDAVNCPVVWSVWSDTIQNATNPFGRGPVAHSVFSQTLVLPEIWQGYRGFREFPKLFTWEHILSQRINVQNMSSRGQRGDQIDAIIYQIAESRVGGSLLRRRALLDHSAVRVQPLRMRQLCWLRWNWNTGFLDYIIPKTPRGFSRCSETSGRTKQASCRYSWKTVFSRLLHCSHRFP